MPGAVVEPHQRQFLQTQGPVGRDEFRHPLKFCAPEILCQAQGITPVNGGLGADSPCQGEMARRARGGRESRHGERSSPLRRPPASYGSFSTWKRNSPRRAKPCKTRRRGHGLALRESFNDVCSLKRPPHPSRLRRATFPPGGRLFGGLPPHPSPLGPPDPIPSGLRPSPLDKGSRPSGGRRKG